MSDQNQKCSDKCQCWLENVRCPTTISSIELYIMQLRMYFLLMLFGMLIIRSVTSWSKLDKEYNVSKQQWSIYKYRKKFHIIMCTSIHMYSSYRPQHQEQVYKIRFFHTLHPAIQLVALHYLYTKLTPLKSPYLKHIQVTIYS